MARLIQVSTGRTFLLEPETLVGRSPTCPIRLHGPSASTQQAVIRWKGQHWELADRSRNGTTVDGVRIHHATHRLHRGEVLVFGGQEDEWRVVDLDPPSLMLVAVEGSEALLAEDGIIGIPTTENPVWTIFPDADGRFKLESLDADPLPLENGTVFTLGEKTWRFCCPEIVPSTVTSDVFDVRKPTLHFLVSADEEYVELRLEY